MGRAGGGARAAGAGAAAAAATAGGAGARGRGAEDGVLAAARDDDEVEAGGPGRVGLLEAAPPAVTTFAFARAIMADGAIKPGGLKVRKLRRGFHPQGENRRKTTRAPEDFGSPGATVTQSLPLITLTL